MARQFSNGLVGTYKGKEVYKITADEYCEHDRKEADVMFLIGQDLIYHGYIVGGINDKGYLEMLNRPIIYPAQAAKLAAFDKPETPSVKVEEVAPAAINSKIVDEYLASKKSVDFFFEELNK